MAWIVVAWGLLAVRVVVEGSGSNFGNCSGEEGSIESGCGKVEVFRAVVKRVG